MAAEGEDGGTGQTPAWPPTRSAVWNIEGLDTRSGLINAGGMENLYRDNLEEFVRDAKEQLQDLKVAEQSKDWSRFTLAVHSLEGIAGLVGATKANKAAARLEEYALDANYVSLRRETPKFVLRLAALLENIRRFLDAEKQEDVALPPDDLDPLELNLLKNALQNRDVEKVNILLQKYSMEALNQKQKEITRELERDILAFDYQGALRTIDQITHQVDPKGQIAAA
jgi:HPt (histidine-containing phosphotransfer) domain-containing protein